MRGALSVAIVLRLLAARPCSAGAQTTAVPQSPGYVVGHVTCTDTQRPARVAQVRLVPVPTRQAAPAQASKAGKPAGEGLAELGAGVIPVETDMDGNFSIRNAKPGLYYVRVDLEGYMSPLLLFSSKDLQQPDEATRQRIDRELQVVEVHSRAETRVDISLQRGAAIAGTVRFDDGSPAIGIATHCW